MNIALRLENLLLLIFFGSLVSTNSLLSPWIALYFWLPDLAFAGYLFGPKIGALSYNFTHYYGLGVALYGLGSLISSDVLIYAGLIQLAHINFDRFFGYGLKYPDSFHHTHLGIIGRGEKSAT